MPAQQPIDPNSPEGFTIGQQVYDRITNGEIPADNVAWELDTAYGQTRND